MSIENVIQFRKDYNQKHPLGFYSGYLHYFSNVLFAGGLSLYGLFHLHDLKTIQLLAIPIAFIFASLVEYIAHRFVLHVRLKYFPIAYIEHTLMHHFYFTDEHYELESSRDFHRVLFKPYAVFIFLILIAIPNSYIVSLFLGNNVGLLTFATSCAYFLMYETFHLFYHLEKTHLVYKIIPGLSFLREHHRLHHRISIMHKKNFGIILPLFDKIFHTTQRSNF